MHRNGAAHTQAPEKDFVEVVLGLEEMHCRAGIRDAILKRKLAIPRAIAATSVLVPEGIEAGGRKGIRKLPQQCMCSEFGILMYDDDPNPLFGFFVWKMNAGVKTPAVTLKRTDLGSHLL
jgi:hypothetical protein